MGSVKDAAMDSRNQDGCRDRSTHEALSSADAGRLIDHERVEQWLDSLATSSPEPPPRLR